eukprot:5646878-Amphidinium_carterae.1
MSSGLAKMKLTPDVLNGKVAIRHSALHNLVLQLQGDAIAVVDGPTVSREDFRKSVVALARELIGNGLTKA